jgi:hypothetical protein
MKPSARRQHPILRENQWFRDIQNARASIVTPQLVGGT